MIRQILILLSISAVGILGLPTNSWQCCWWTTSSSQPQNQPAQMTQSVSVSQELRLDSGPQQFETHAQSFRDVPTYTAPVPPVVRQERVSSSSHRSEYQFFSDRTSSGVSPDGTMVRSGSQRRGSGKKYSYQNSRQVGAGSLPPPPAPIPITVETNSYWDVIRCRISYTCPQAS